MGVESNVKSANSPQIRFLSARNETKVLCRKLSSVPRKTWPNLVVVDGKVAKGHCRCGDSSYKPFCDGTYAKNSFRAHSHEVKVL